MTQRSPRGTAGELTLEALPPIERVLVLSDTHMPRMAKHLPRQLADALDQAELVLHAGDFVTGEALAILERFAPVVGVAGNNDDEAVHARFPTRRLLEWRGFRLGLTHGHEGRGRTTPDRAFDEFRVEDVDAVIFGHSHIPLREEREGVLLFNPGSPTDKRRQAEFSFGWLHAEPTLRADLEFYARKD